MKDKIKGKFKSEFTRNLAVMFSGNGLALVFPLIMGPFISRLYSPEAFAGFELFVKIAVLLAVISAFRLEHAIILPKKSEEADALFKLSLKILIGVSVFSIFVSWPFRAQIADLLDNQSLADLLLLLPLAVFSFGAFQVVTSYAIRLRKFNIIASNKILAAMTNHGSKYIFGMWKPTSVNLVWGQIIGSIIPVLAFFKIEKMRHSVRTMFKQEVPTKVLLKKYRDFPLINSSHAFFDEGQRAMLLFIISAYHGALVLGLFAFGLRYIKVPVQVFASSLSQVLNEKWARDLNEGINIRPAVVKVVFLLMGVGIIPLGTLFFFGEPIFSFVFGKEWATAGIYSAMMAPWLFMNFLTNPISFLPILANKQRMSFAIAVIGNIIIIAIVWWMSMQGFEFEQILMALTAGYAIHLLVVLLWFINISGQASDKNY